MSPDPASLPAPRRGGAGVFAGTILGGLVAAGIGAGAVLYLLPGGLSEPAATPREIALLGAVKTQGDDLAAMRKELADLRAGLDRALASAAGTTDAAARADALDGRLSATEAALADLGRRIDAAAQRIAALEERPAGTAAPGAAADAAGGAASLIAPGLDEMRRLVETQKAAAAEAEARLASAAREAEARVKAAEERAAALKAEAEATARTASARAAVSHLRAALQNGAPISTALEELAAAGVAVPQALLDQSGGVPSMTALTEAFPDAARAALTLSLRETAGDGTLGRVWAFLRAESGARSLSPRAGNDPDAVLSRAEAALRAGDLPAAVAEIGGLPEAGRTRMAEWVALAGRRIAAVAAVEAVAAQTD